MGDNGLTERIKIASLAFWKYEKHHPIGAIECKDADVLTVSNSFMVYETEVKRTVSDLLSDIRTKYTSKHRYFYDGESPYYNQTNYFYFAVPEFMKDKAISVCDERYPYAGILVFKDTSIDVFHPANIELIRRSKRFKRIRPMTIRELKEISYSATNTTMRFIDKYLSGTP